MHSNAPRDLVAVLSAILEEIPEDESSLVADLTRIQQSAMYASPETRQLWWRLAADTLAKAAPDPLVGWQQKVADIFTAVKQKSEINAVASGDEATVEALQKLALCSMVFGDTSARQLIAAIRTGKVPGIYCDDNHGQCKLNEAHDGALIDALRTQVVELQADNAKWERQNFLNVEQAEKDLAASKHAHVAEIAALQAQVEGLNNIVDVARSEIRKVATRFYKQGKEACSKAYAERDAAVARAEKAEGEIKHLKTVVIPERTNGRDAARRGVEELEAQLAQAKARRFVVALGRRFAPHTSGVVVECSDGPILDYEATKQAIIAAGGEIQ